MTNFANAVPVLEYRGLVRGRAFRSAAFIDVDSCFAGSRIPLPGRNEIPTSPATRGGVSGRSASRRAHRGSSVSDIAPGTGGAEAARSLRGSLSLRLNIDSGLMSARSPTSTPTARVGLAGRVPCSSPLPRHLPAGDREGDANTYASDRERRV